MWCKKNTTFNFKLSSVSEKIVTGLPKLEHESTQNLMTFKIIPITSYSTKYGLNFPVLVYLALQFTEFPCMLHSTPEI